MSAQLIPKINCTLQEFRKAAKAINFKVTLKQVSFDGDVRRSWKLKHMLLNTTVDPLAVTSEEHYILHKPAYELMEKVRMGKL